MSPKQLLGYSTRLSTTVSFEAPGDQGGGGPRPSTEEASVQTARKPPVAMIAKHVLGRKNVTTHVVVPRRGRRVPLAEQAPNVPVTVDIDRDIRCKAG